MKANAATLAALLGLSRAVCDAYPLDVPPLTIDAFEYADRLEAQAAWIGRENSPPVEMADSGEWGDWRVMLLPCSFATQPTRCYWDRDVSLDLSGVQTLALDIYVPSLGAVSALTLYLRSGSGWYFLSNPIDRVGWQTFSFPVSDFGRESSPGGWNQISRVRLAAWQGSGGAAVLALRELRAFVPDLFILRDTSAADQDTVDQVVERHEEWLGDYDLVHNVVANSAVRSNSLAGVRMAILPFNAALSGTILTELERFVATGGKLVVYYDTPTRVRSLLGIRFTAWYKRDYAAFNFTDDGIANLPPRVLQSSWNIWNAAPDGPHHTRVIATWEDGAGNDTGHAAWLAGDNGLFMSHVLLGDDRATKRRMLLALVAHYFPAAWKTAAVAAIDRIGQVGRFHAYIHAVADIRARAEPTLRAVPVAARLEAAELARVAAYAAYASADYGTAVQAAWAARDSLVAAYQLAQEPVRPEFRALWEHKGTGPYPGDWPAAVEVIVANGFNAVMANVLWAGTAHYDSDVLPHSSTYETYGDQLAACVPAAHARGLEVHAWKVNWNLAGAPADFIGLMRGAGRTQVSAYGTPVDWLCPSHPDNQALERDSMLEVARRYDVDGLHFDYIRYPNSSCCYCGGCRERFESEAGVTVTNWPTGVLAAGALRDSFRTWRRGHITALVQAVHDGVQAIRPSVRISAAVFPDYPSAVDGVGQDWRRWIELGIVDFLCPMNYTDDHDDFEAFVTAQLGYAAGRVPIYPGIGAHQLDPDAAVAQILITRSLGTGGFTLFDFNREVAGTILPGIVAGATANDEPDSDGDRMADAWELGVFGSLETATPVSDADHDGHSDRAEYMAGTSPTNATDVLQLDIGPRDGVLSVYWTGRAAEGAGYAGIARHYCLETATNLLSPVTWSPHAEHADEAIATGSREIVCPVQPVSPLPAFHRVRAWLQSAP